MSSGLTTTGASIITDLSIIDNSIKLWRSMSHFVGGMGVLVLALAVLPEISASSVHAMKAEVPGPQFGIIVEPSVDAFFPIRKFVHEKIKGTDS